MTSRADEIRRMESASCVAEVIQVWNNDCVVVRTIKNVELILMLHEAGFVHRAEGMHTVTFDRMVEFNDVLDAFDVTRKVQRSK